MRNPKPHTKGPLTVGEVMNDGHLMILDSGPEVPCIVALVTTNYADGKTDLRQGNAEELVHRWNCYEDMLDILRDCITEGDAACFSVSQDRMIGFLTRRLNNISAMAREIIRKAERE